jgi:hypothetical protein
VSLPPAFTSKCFKIATQADEFHHAGVGLITSNLQDLKQPSHHLEHPSLSFDLLHLDCLLSTSR